MKELRVSVTEMVVAVVALIAATVTSVTGHMSSDALVGVYGSVLGYVFGRVRNGVEHRTHEKVNSPHEPSPETVEPTASTESSVHVVPGTENEK